MPLFAWMAAGVVAALLFELLASGTAIRSAIGRLAVTSLLAVDGALVAVFVSSPGSWHGAASLTTGNLAIAAIGAIAVVLAWQALRRVPDRRTSTERP